MSTSNQNLYLVMIKAQPTPQHPLYWKVQAGVLHAWIYEETGPAAVNRVLAILQHLPYEMLGERQGWRQVGDVAAVIRGVPAFARSIADVQLLGFGLFYDAIATGDADFNFDKLLEEFFR